jgi:hypothetical protein
MQPSMYKALALIPGPSMKKKKYTVCSLFANTMLLYVRGLRICRFWCPWEWLCPGTNSSWMPNSDYIDIQWSL